MEHTDIEAQIKELKEASEQMSAKVEDIHVALMGDLTKEGWLSRLRSAEKTVATHQGYLKYAVAQLLLFIGWLAVQIWDSSHGA